MVRRKVGMALRCWRRMAGAMALGIAVSGCGSLGKPAMPAAVYDLGLGAALKPASRLLPNRVEVRAPSWLAGSGMQYRLDYEQPAQRSVFAESRWASPPAEMLERSLTRAFSPQDPTRGQEECRLRLELDEFAQVFDASDRSRAVIVVRAELLSARGEGVLARRSLDVFEEAPSADARGGVLAFRTASARLATEIASWLNGLELSRVEGGRSTAACIARPA